MLLTSIISLLLLSGIDAGGTAPEGNSVRESRILFRFASSRYDDNYRDNASVADQLVGMMETIGLENIDSVSVVAYASPDGVYEHNIALCRRRAREFDAAVRKRIGVGEVPFSINIRADGEAWGMLRERVVADTQMSQTARDRVLAQLDNHKISDATRKWRFMNNYLGATPQEGDVYSYLLRNHYVYLRCLSIKLYVKEPEEKPEPEPVEAVEPAEPAESVIEPVVEPAAPVASVTSPAAAPAASLAPALAIPAISAVSAPVVGRHGTPILGVSTNLLYDATYIPNYGFTSIPSFSLEFYPARGHWTVGADLEWSHWRHYDTHRFMQIHNASLWTRRYFKPGDNGFKGLYLSGGVNAAQYGIGWKAKGWEGEGLGISAGVGYKWTKGRFFFDTGLNLGFFYSGYDPYVWGNDATGWYYYDYAGDPNEFKRRNKRLMWFGPTRVYFSVGVNLFKRKK